MTIGAFYVMSICSKKSKRRTRKRKNNLRNYMLHALESQNAKATETYNNFLLG